MSGPTLPHALASARRKWSQQERCKRCKWSVSLTDWAFCHITNMSLKFDAGDVRRYRDNQRIVCDGKDWQYAEVVEQEGGERE